MTWADDEHINEFYAKYELPNELELIGRTILRAMTTFLADTVRLLRDICDCECWGIRCIAQFLFASF